MIWPEAVDERLMELRSRGIDARPRVEWRSNGTFVSLALFILAAVAVGAAYGFLSLIEVAAAGMLVAAAAIAVAEVLIQRFRFFGTGVESALWLGGAFVFIFGLPREGRPEVLLLFAAASAGAGLRVRNALFGALAVVFVMAYAVVEGAPLAAAATGTATSLLALFALRIEWKRPSTEKLWIALLIIPPIASAFLTITRTPRWWLLVHLGAAIACAVAGLALCGHAQLIGAGVHGAIVVMMLELHGLLPLRAEWELILGGAFLLAAAALAGRALRDRTRGIVAAPDAMTAFDDEAQILATIAAQPQVASPEARRDGGGFGGAGATGDF